MLCRYGREIVSCEIWSIIDILQLNCFCQLIRSGPLLLMCGMKASMSDLKEMELNHHKMCSSKGRPTKLKCHDHVMWGIALWFTISRIILRKYIMTQFLTAPVSKLYTIQKCSDPQCFNAAISTCSHPQFQFQWCIGTFVHPQNLILHKPTIIYKKTTAFSLTLTTLPCLGDTCLCLFGCCL